MKKLIWVLMLVILVGCSSSDDSPERKRLEKDVDQLVEIMIDEELLFCDQAELENIRDEVVSKLEGDMSEREFYLALLPIVNCGMMSLNYPEETRVRFENDEVYIPIKVENRNGKMYLIDDITETLPRGTEIREINEWPIDEIMKILYLGIPKMESFLEKFKSSPVTDADRVQIREQIDMIFSGHLVTIFDSKEYVLTLIDGGKLKKYTVPAIDQSSLSAWLFPPVEDLGYPVFKAEDNSINEILKNTGFVVKYNNKDYWDLMMGK